MPPPRAGAAADRVGDRRLGSGVTLWPFSRSKVCPRYSLGGMKVALLPGLPAVGTAPEGGLVAICCSSVLRSAEAAAAAFDAAAEGGAETSRPPAPAAAGAGCCCGALSSAGAAACVPGRSPIDPALAAERGRGWRRIGRRRRLRLGLRLGLVGGELGARPCSPSPGPRPGAPRRARSAPSRSGRRRA